VRSVALFALLVTVAGCSLVSPVTVPSIRPGPSGTPVPAARAGDLAATFDSAPASGHLWTREGRPVEPGEIGTSGGPEHCGWQAATFLHIAWPVGTRLTPLTERRQYVRDPQGVLPAPLRDRLDLRANLPGDARPTGYSYGSIEIYLSPSDQDNAIYVVGSSSVERWPRSEPKPLCM
jgi:hypothetical protein